MEGASVAARAPGPKSPPPTPLLSELVHQNEDQDPRLRQRARASFCAKAAHGYRYLSPLRLLRTSASLLRARTTRSGERVLCMVVLPKIGDPCPLYSALRT